MNWKKSLSIVGTLIMVVGQNIAGVTAFAETISNQESIVEDIYFEKDNTKISEITLEQGKEETITFVDENKEDEEAIVTLPESTKLNLTETNSQLGEESIVNYNQDTNQVKIAFKNKEQNIKRTNLVLTTTDSVENNQERMYAKVVRQDSQIYTSKQIMITITSSENNKQQEETQKNEEDGESAQHSSRDKEITKTTSSNQSSEVNGTNEQISSTKNTIDNTEALANKEQDVAIQKGALHIDKNNFLDFFRINGSDVTYDQATGVVTLTPDSTNKTGNVTLNSKISMHANFVLDGEINIGNKSQINGGADGIGFGFHPQSIDSLGLAGGGLGIQGIDGAFGWKADTWWNSIDPPEFGSTIGRGVAFGGFMYYDSESGLVPTINTSSVPAKAISEPKDNIFRPIKFMYNSETKTMTVNYDGQVWSMLASDYISADSLAFLITATTGSRHNLQQFKINSFDYTPYGIINTEYKEQGTNKTLIDGEEFSGLVDTKQEELRRLNQKVLDMGYTYSSVEASNPNSYDEKSDSGTFTVDRQTITYWYTKNKPNVSL
ncbi:hypothetical protein H5O62_001392, partial [Enterococcus faecalis]|nr:hypothetical protein [Enterococcus faecalis]ELZ4686823.1 hypothetical protein [Enterococcus faecalis]